MAKAPLPSNFPVFNALDFELLSQSGVYFLLHKGEVVYVGQSRNVFRRIGSHMVESRKTFDAVSFRATHPDQLLEIEARYITAFNPKYNEAGTSLVRAMCGRDDAPVAMLALPGDREWVGAKTAAEQLGISVEALFDIPASKIARKRQRLPRSPKRVIKFNAGDIYAYAKDLTTKAA